MTTVTVKNLAQVIAGLTGYEAKMHEAAVYGLSQVAFAMERQAKSDWAPRHAPGTKTTATPFGKPASVTGNLRRSIHTEITRQGFGSYMASVFPTMIYSRAVETGMNGEWPVKYPYMEPAREYVQPRANQIFLSAYKRRIRR